MMQLARSAGFTLIETLVAFVIAATSLGLLFGIHSNAATTSVVAEEYLFATELAQSLIAELTATERTVSFARSGVARDKYRWTARAEALAMPHPEQTDTADRYELRAVTVRVDWRSRDKERQIELQTVKPFFQERDL